MAFSEYQVHPDFVEDEWGTWLTVNAPLRNAKGAVWADLSGADVIQDFRRWSAGPRLNCRRIGSM